MNIKLARINNHKMILKFAQDEMSKLAQTAPATATPATATPATPATNNRPPANTPAANTNLENDFSQFLNRHNLGQLKDFPWVKTLYLAYRTQANGPGDNQLAEAIRTSSGMHPNVREHLTQAMQRLNFSSIRPVDPNAPGKAMNEYNQWHMQTKSERDRTQGLAGIQKSNDVNQAIQDLYAWEESQGENSESWNRLVNATDSRALRQAQTTIARSVLRAGGAAVNSNPRAFAEIAGSMESYFAAILQQGFAREIQAKGYQIPDDVIYGWAINSGELQRMQTEFQKFSDKIEAAQSAYETQRNISGTRARTREELADAARRNAVGRATRRTGIR
jgi:hypothetical protein